MGRSRDAARPVHRRGPDPTALLDHLLETLTVLDASGRVVFSTGDRRGVMGFPPGALRDTFQFDRIHPDDRAHVIQEFERCLASPSGEVVGEFRIADAEGEWQHVEARACNLLADPGVGGILVATRNITDRVDARAALAASEERLRALVAGSVDPIVLLDRHLVPVYCSPSVESRYGLRAGEADAARAARALVHPEDRRRVLSVLCDLAAGEPGTETTFEYRARSTDGEWRWLDAHGVNRLDVPGVDGLVLHGHDVTERRDAETTLRYRVTHDPLTGLPNRSFLMTELEEAIRAGRAPALTVLFLDLDRLKLVNDSLGHDAGDQVLVEAARRARAVVRDHDLVARLAGDEFVILCDRLDAERALTLGRRLVDALEQPIPVAGDCVRISASVGILPGASSASAAELLSDADAAMYAAKGRGRGTVELFDGRLRARAVERLRIEGLVREALAEDRLFLEYQSIHDLDSGAVVGTEALLRCRLPDGTVLAPDAFIPVVEETGLILPIGDWVLEHALAQLASWGPPAADLRMSVNLSARNLAVADLADEVVQALDRHGVEPDRLCIEITETALLRTEWVLDASSPIGSTLRALAERGVRLAIDDFGTGYSSLAHLRALPMTDVKIDRSFVSGLGRGGPDEAIADGVLRIAAALDLDVVAEGVETDEQADTLRRLGCRYVQGFRFATPRSPTGLLEMLTAARRVA